MKCERMNFENMSKEELVQLLKKIREGLFGIEDAEAALCWVGEKLNVTFECGGSNQKEDGEWIEQ